jgi:exonuclease SbcC
MKKPQMKKQAEVELDFEVNGIDYSIKRVVESGKGTTRAEIREKGELLDASAQGVTRIVERVLQMDYDLFSKAVYSEQDGLDYFLRIPRGQRMQHIDRMLKVDRFEKARGEAVSLGNRVKQAREDKLKMVSDLEEEGIREKLRDAEKEIGLLEKSRSELKTRIEEVRKKKGIISERISRAEKIEGRLNQARTLLEGASYGLQETTETLKKRRGKLKGRDSGKLSGDMERLGKESERLEAGLREKSELFEKGRSGLASVNNMIKINRESMEELEKAGAKCPVCESEITGKKREDLLGKRRGEQENLRKHAGKIAGDMEKLSRDKEVVEKKLREVDLEREKLRSMQDEAKETEDLDRRRKEYEERKAGLEKDMKDLEKEFREAGLEGLRKELQEIAAEESGVVEKISGIEERVEDKREILRDMRERSDMLERYKEEAGRDEEIAGQLGDFVKVLKITQDQLRQEFLKTVNSIMDSIWGELYPYGDFERVRLAVDQDYILQLKELGGWISAEGGVSGGERSMACLALRIAFSLAFIPNLKWLILDEPTHNLDANAIGQFAEILRERMGQFAEQVFLITHEERISEGVTGALYRLERNKEANEPTRVEAGKI